MSSRITGILEKLDKLEELAGQLQNDLSTENRDQETEVQLLEELGHPVVYIVQFFDGTSEQIRILDRKELDPVIAELTRLRERLPDDFDGAAKPGKRMR